MTNRSRSIAVLAATALLVQGCVTSSRVAKMGDEEAAEVEQTMGLVRDTKPTAYVQEIGKRLAEG